MKNWSEAVQDKTMKTRRLTLAQHRARVSNGVCPRCGDHRIVRIVKVTESETGSTKFGGVFYCCAGERGSECYHLSSENSRYLSESAEGTEEPRMPVPTPVGPGVVKRRKP